MSIALYGAESWTLRKVDQKCLESFKFWCWRRMEKISWTNRVRNEEVLHRVKDRNILHTTERRKVNLICHILRSFCLLKHVIGRKIAGTIDVTERLGTTCKLLLDYLKELRHWKWKEEARDRTLWRTRFGRDFGMNDNSIIDYENGIQVGRAPHCPSTLTITLSFVQPLYS